MMYDNGGVNTDSKSDRGGRVDGSNCCSESTDPVSDLLSNLYSELDIFLCKG